MGKVLRTLSTSLTENTTTWKNYLIVLMVVILFLIFPRNTNAGDASTASSVTGKVLTEKEYIHTP